MTTDFFGFSPAVGYIIATLLGVVFTWAFTHRRDSRRFREQKTAEKKEKLETLMNECLQIDAWADKQQKIYLSYPAHEDAAMNLREKIKEFSKMEAIVLLHFRESTDEVKALQSAGIAFADYLLEVYDRRKRQEKNHGGILQLDDPENPHELPENRQKLSAARDKFIEEILKLISELPK